MTQKLKIKVKETIEEKRPLNDAEREIYDIFRMTPTLPIYNEIKKFWEIQGFDYKSYDGNEGTFKKEIFRDATPEEFRAILLSMFFDKYNLISLCDKSEIYIKGSGADMSYTGGYILGLIEDKQIILELEEPDPQLKKNDAPFTVDDWRNMP